MKSLRTLIRVAFVAGGLLLGVGIVHAIDIHGTISSTLTIMEDSQLVGDVTCTVLGAPCIQFGAPGITLKLNGFTMTGLADPTTGCSGDFPAPGAEDGISTAGQSNVTIQGPGLVQRFRTQGIRVIGSTGVRVVHVTASINCGSGILVIGSSTDNHLEANILVRNGNAAAPCGGILHHWQ